MLVRIKAQDIRKGHLFFPPAAPFNKFYIQKLKKEDKNYKGCVNLKKYFIIPNPGLPGEESLRFLLSVEMTLFLLLGQSYIRFTREIFILEYSIKQYYDGFKNKRKL